MAENPQLKTAAESLIGMCKQAIVQQTDGRMAAAVIYAQAVLTQETLQALVRLLIDTGTLQRVSMDRYTVTAFEERMKAMVGSPIIVPPGTKVNGT